MTKRRRPRKWKCPVCGMVLRRPAFPVRCACGVVANWAEVQRNIIWECPTCSTRHAIKPGMDRKCICGTVRDPDGVIVLPEGGPPIHPRELDVDYNLESGKVVRWGKAIRRWLKYGRPVRNPRQIRRLWRTCKRCEHFDEPKGACSICQCRVNLSSLAMANKLAMATEACPVGKWTATVAMSTDDRRAGGCKGCRKRRRRKGVGRGKGRTAKPRRDDGGRK